MKELGNPPLRPVWVNAKKKASDDAKKLKQADKYSALEKKFKVDLGPDLEKWPKLYPDYRKLEDSKKKIEETMKLYVQEIDKSGLDLNISKGLKLKLDEIKKALDGRLK